MLIGFLRWLLRVLYRFEAFNDAVTDWERVRYFERI